MSIFILEKFWYNNIDNLNIKNIQNNVGSYFSEKGCWGPTHKETIKEKSYDARYKPGHSSWMGLSMGFRDTSSSGKATLTTRHFVCITGN